MIRTNRALLIGDSTEPPADWPRTLQAALDRAAQDLSRGITYVDDEGLERFQNYRHLRRAAGALGEYLAEQLPPGTPVLIAAGDARVQLTAFWGCVLAGAVPVPVGRTGALGTVSAVGERIRAAHELLGHPVVLVDEPVAAVDVENQIAVGADGTARPLGGQPADRTAAPPLAAGIALGLLTSGSTGRPKCVLLTHSALAHRAWAAAEFNDLRASDVALNWMPLDHVGGIVMWATQAVFLGCSLVQVNTARVLADPLAWLDLLEAHRAGTTWAPNFGFALVCSALRRAPDRRWRLHRLRHVLDGGEAVVATVADEFIDLLAPHGLSRAAFRPAWGMSETGSGVVYSRPSPDDPGIPAVRVRMTADERVRHEAPGSGGVLELAVTGTPVPGVRIRVVRPDGSVCDEDQLGAVQVAGATLFAGYLGADAALRDGWFTTGDQGFVTGGALVVTGRDDDVVVINGGNIPCQEIEAVVAQVEGVLDGYAAFTVLEHPDGPPRRAVFVSVRPDVEVADAIRERVALRFGFAVDEVRVLSTTDFPRTATGKIQRARLRAGHRAPHPETTVRRRVSLVRRRDPLAAKVSQVWADLLGDQPRPATSFFAAGGTSMAAVRCVAALGALLGRRVPVGLLYEHPTFAEFVAALEPSPRRAEQVPALVEQGSPG
ncbi:non-ribosomal peptide synthetase [Nocardia brasiliensis]